jgi:hypothetical protein
MNLQGRNLQEGFTGDDVRLLHTELTLPILAVPDSERLGAHAAGHRHRRSRHCGSQQHGGERKFPPASSVSGRVYSALSASVGGSKRCR